MKQAEKNMKQRSSYLPIGISWVLKIAFTVAGIALWGWSFVAVVAGLYFGFKLLKGLLSCLLSLLLLLATGAAIIFLLTIIINNL
ncbi:hypothetical protein EZS27_015165 [termite gut metagenome]|uniref:Uncharacterized protein n=1 Tax=termite gut metagenome TaxID=433724 RepID=A0A5J4RUS1_9ZZZZ